MFTNRLFNLIVVAVIVVITALGLQQAFSTKAIAPETDKIYSESKESTLREYQLGERYGALPEHVTWFSAEQINRESILGERYGVMPQQDAYSKSYRSALDECFDVPLREVADCRNANQTRGASTSAVNVSSLNNHERKDVQNKRYDYRCCGLPR